MSQQKNWKAARVNDERLGWVSKRPPGLLTKDRLRTGGSPCKEPTRMT